MSAAPTLPDAMPATLDAEYVPIMQIRPSPLNIRGEDLGDLDGLAASIEAEGIIEPLIVDQSNSQLIAGHRRLAAAKQAGLTHVPVVWRDNGKRGDTEILMLIENLQRTDLTPLQEADAFAALTRRYKMTQREIERRTGVSQGQVSKRLKLAGLPTKVRARIDEGTLTIEDAIELARLPDKGSITAVLKEVDGRSWRSVKEVVASRLRDLAAAQKRTATLEQLRLEHAKDGVEILDEPKFRWRGEVRRHGKPIEDMSDDVDRKKLLAAGDLAVVVLADGDAIEVCTNPHRYETVDDEVATGPSVHERSSELSKAWEKHHDQVLELGRRWARLRHDADELMVHLVEHGLSTGADRHRMIDEICRTLKLEWKKSHTLGDKEQRVQAALAEGRHAEVASAIAAWRLGSAATESWRGRKAWADGTLADWFTTIGFDPPPAVKQGLSSARACDHCHMHDDWGLDPDDEWLDRTRCARHKDLVDEAAATD